MACISLIEPMAMATTQLARVISYQDVSTIHVETSMERSPLRMSWVVATDDKGNRKLQMQWEPSA